MYNQYSAKEPHRITSLSPPSPARSATTTSGGELRRAFDWTMPAQKRSQDATPTSPPPPPSPQQQQPPEEKDDNSQQRNQNLNGEQADDDGEGTLGLCI